MITNAYHRTFFFQQWEKRWDKCMASQEEYSEWDEMRNAASLASSTHATFEFRESLGLPRIWLVLIIRIRPSTYEINSVFNSVPGNQCWITWICVCQPASQNYYLLLPFLSSSWICCSSNYLCMPYVKCHEHELTIQKITTIPAAISMDGIQL